MTRADAVVVGAGAAGLLFAARLAEAGRAVLVLEAGPARSRADLVSSQIWARRLKWGGAPMVGAGEDSQGLNFVTGSGVGGAALHHYAAWGRLHPEDFTTRSDHGTGHDWPIGYDDLRPYYDRVQREAGVAGDAAAEVWRPPGEPYPMPATRMFRHGEILARGFASTGRRISPSPCAIASEDYAGRPACLYDGWCDAGCPIGALANPLTLHLPRAEAAGARIETGATVTRILASGARASGVTYVDSAGEERRAEARVVVLAANPVQNARLMLASGVGGPMVGRFVAMHTIAAVFGLFDEETDSHLGHTAGQIMSQDDYGKTRAGPDGWGAVSWMAGAAIKPNDLVGIAGTRPDLFGPRLHGFMVRAARRIAQMGSVNETIPLDGNRVALSGERDRFGVPLPVVTHTLDPRSRALWGRARDDGVAMLKAAGATEAWGAPTITTHLMGGTIMGRDPAASVADGFGRVHACPNLVVAGPGLFPSTGAVGPTFTLYALAERTLDHMLAHWSEYGRA